MLRCSSLVLVGLAVFVADGEKPPKDDAPKTVVYDVNDLLHRRGVQSGFDRIEEIVQALVTTADPPVWKKGDRDGATLKVLNDVKLEVTARQATHAQIEETLTALRRLMDVVVDVRGELVEVERAWFEKEIKPRLEKEPEGKRGRLLLDDEQLVALRKQMTRVAAHDTRIANGKEDHILSQRTAVVYQAGERKTAVAYHGVSLRTGVAVSWDRRSIRLKLAQTVTELVEIVKIQVPDRKGQPQLVEAPTLNESRATLTVDVDDADWVLLPVAYRRPGDKDGKTVLLALVRPAISIGAEERERLKMMMDKK